MISDFPLQPAFDIGQRLELRGIESYTWLIITFSTIDLEAIQSFMLEIGATTNLPFRIIDANELDSTAAPGLGGTSIAAAFSAPAPSSFGSR